MKYQLKIDLLFLSLQDKKDIFVSSYPFNWLEKMDVGGNSCF